jgi:acyl-CoA reductase-like NAD-dependent aldehyde dehydrogenase
MSTERILVTKSRYDELTAALASTWQALGNSQNRALFTPASARRFNSLVTDSKERGATNVLTIDNDETVTDTGGSFVAHAILGPATPEMALWKEESFGPVSVIICVDDDGRSTEDVIEEMISIANESDYGLTAAVWGADVSRAQRVARRLETGAVHINSPVSLAEREER